MAKTITTIVYGDDIFGSRSVQLNICSALVFKREDESHLKEYTRSFKTPAVYVLLNKKTQEAYIGQTDDFQVRLQQHIAHKEFWEEAFAFTAKDGSISVTETKYLEAEVYQLADSVKHYKLTNSQIPQAPYIQEVQRVNADEFLELMKPLALFTGCDIFIKKGLHVKTVANKPQIAAEGSTSNTALEGRVRLMLNGNGPFKKNEFVHAFIKEYINKYPSVTIKELKERFPMSLLGKWGRWNLIEDDIAAAKKLREKGNTRHFLKDRDVLRSGDNVPFVVCSQWDKDNLPNILSLVEDEGWSYSVLNN